MAILCTDFGSTFTKLTAIDPASGQIIAFARAFTTIDTDIMDGFSQALADIKAQCGLNTFDQKFAASSAAGGLKMMASGLVPDLTAKAARLAAASAGAKVLNTYAYELTPADVAEIETIAPDIILLCGGIDGGNTEVLLKNANTLAHTCGHFQVIIAGNRSAADQALTVLTALGKPAVVCDNVMPQFGKLNIAPAKAAIRDIFIKSIIAAKGLDKAQAFMDASIIPTPLAVLNGARLLSQGVTDAAGEIPGMGELMLFDIGGATTDVYSIASGLPHNPHVYLQGLQEPFDKRTVEGDIGMRYSLAAMVDTLLKENPYPQFAHGVTLEAVQTWAAMCQASPGILPTGEYESYRPVDLALAKEAIRLAAARHVGTTETTYTPAGETIIQTGKDLTQVKTVIGTGGALIGATAWEDILSAATYHPGDLNLLKPLAPKLLLDHQYAFSALGLLGDHHPRLAFTMMQSLIT